MESCLICVGYVFVPFELVTAHIKPQHLKDRSAVPFGLAIDIRVIGGLESIFYTQHLTDPAEEILGKLQAVIRDHRVSCSVLGQPIFRERSQKWVDINQSKRYCLC